MSDITREQSEQYVNSGGSRCPLCRSTNIEAEQQAEISSDGAYQNVRCLDCDAEWIDCYVLVAAESTQD